MATTLTATEKDKLRQAFARDFPDPPIKTVLNAALDALDDWFETQRATIKSTMDSAATGAGGSAFTAAQAKTLGRYWLRTKFGKGG